jgi:8-oxo-dGTP diphosphatase
MQFSLTVKGIIRNPSGAILVVKRSDRDDYKPGVWETVGGGVDREETPQQALEREIFEEAGIAVTVGVPFHVFTFRKDSGQFKVGITFLCDTLEETVTLSPEHSEYRWIQPAEFKDLESIPSLYQEIADYAQKYAR